MGATRAHALDHVVLVIFENRSFDNLLGRLYSPEEKPEFEGVIDKGLEESGARVGRSDPCRGTG